MEDENYSHKLPQLTAGSQVAWKQRLSGFDTIAQIEQLCIAAGVSGIFCTNQKFLEKLLSMQPDFLPPNNKRGITLDDYQGSLLHTVREGIPVVIGNPLSNLVTVKWAQSATTRFVRKLTDPGSWFPQTKFTWELAEPSKIDAIFARWEQEAALIAVDIETPIDNPNRTINCVGYAAWFPKTGTSECLVIPFTDMFWYEWVRRFNNLPQPKVLQNGLYDNIYFMRFGLPLHNWLYDTQHLFHSWLSEYPKRLDFITASALRNVRYWKDDGKTGNLTDYYRYNAKDCWATLNSFLAILHECPPWALTNYCIEFPLVFPCLTCELDGLKIDTERLATVAAVQEQKIILDTAAFQSMIGIPNFNVASPPQTAALFKILGVGHLPDTAKASMLKARAAHPLNERILGDLVSLREARKLQSTYFKEEKFWNGRLFYRLNPAGTDTGRLASSESSFWCGLQIQNIPRGDSVKQCIIADDGWELCEIDKEQSEARCVAYLAGEQTLIDLVESPHDYHSWNAAAFFGVPYERIYDESRKKTLDKVIRDLSKRTNHGANYNMGPDVMLDTMGPKLVSKAKVTLKLPASFSLRKVCQFLLDRYSATYPGVKGKYYDSLIAGWRKTSMYISPRGWVRVFFGDPTKAKHHLNALVAHPSQNLSVDIINEEFYNIWHAQIYGELRGIIRVKAQIHDSILFQIRPSHRSWAAKIEETYMRTKVTITGADGKTRIMTIPNAVSDLAVRWSDTKE